MGESADWSDLPKGLWQMMGIETNIDLLRFRSVYKSCRSSLLPRITVSLRFPPTITITASSGKHLLRSNIIYRLELFDLSETLSRSSFSKAWLIKVEESNYGRLLDPFTNWRLNAYSHSVTRTLVDDNNFYYDDILVHKGQLYVMDIGDPNQAKGACYDVVDLKIFKLDKDWGTWLDVKNLDEHAFVLAKDCNFSLPARDPAERVISDAKTISIAGASMFIPDSYDAKPYQEHCGPSPYRSQNSSEWN
ncbi:hypothetical protein K1719_019236 [Acacia pycnantha]|nr:hypothetical protein K1719_019236 [Acacia pycnantha]